jgi:chorismate--pyruvate lyase
MARSIIPTMSASGSNHEVLHLGKKPLGAVLFAKTRMHSQKKPLREIARLDKPSALWKKCLQLYPELPSASWARRTLYKLKGRPLLVSEVFLPALLDHLLD